MSLKGISKIKDRPGPHSTQLVQLFRHLNKEKVISEFHKSAEKNNTVITYGICQSGARKNMTHLTSNRNKIQSDIYVRCYISDIDASEL